MNRPRSGSGSILQPYFRKGRLHQPGGDGPTGLNGISSEVFELTVKPVILAHIQDSDHHSAIQNDCVPGRLCITIRFCAADSLTQASDDELVSRDTFINFANVFVRIPYVASLHRLESLGIYIQRLLRLRNFLLRRAFLLQYDFAPRKHLSFKTQSIGILFQPHAFPIYINCLIRHAPVNIEIYSHGLKH